MRIELRFHVMVAYLIQAKLLKTHMFIVPSDALGLDTRYHQMAHHWRKTHHLLISLISFFTRIEIESRIN